MSNKITLIDILSPNMKFGMWGKFKTKAWNFVLPPHIRLVVPEPKEKKRGSDE